MSQITISKLKEIILDEYQKLTEGVELFTKDDVKKNRDAIVKIFNKVIPYADGIGIGVSKESIIGKFSLDKKNTWPNGYIENSRCGMFTLYNDGELKIEILSWGTYNQRKKVPKFRKSKVKSIEQAVAKSLKHLKLLTNKKYSLDVLPEGKLSEVNQKNLYVADQRYVGKYIIWVLSDNRSFRTAIMGKKGFDNFSSNDTDDLFKLWNLTKKFKGKPIPDIATEGKLTEAKESIFDVAARVLKNKQYEKYKGVRIDLQTANLLSTVHSKVNNKMRSILTKLGDQNIKQLINTLWAIAK